MLKTRVAVVVAVLIAGTVSAQPPPSPAALLAKIAALEQENAQLRASCAITAPTLVTLASPARPQTLGEASAAARQVEHGWPASVNQVPIYDPTRVAPAPGDTRIVSADLTPPAAPPTLTPANEAQWKGRMRTLRMTFENDQTILAAAVTRERALDTQLHRTADDVLYIRDRIQRGVVEADWQAAVTDVSRLKAQVTNDTRAIANLELEAHRQGVPPGWLILE